MECFEHLYANKFDNLDIRDKFLEEYNLSKFAQEEYKIDRPISVK